jgi:hypothetical protein
MHRQSFQSDAFGFPSLLGFSVLLVLALLRGLFAMNQLKHIQCHADNPLFAIRLERSGTQKFGKLRGLSVVALLISPERTQRLSLVQSELLADHSQQAGRR